jgi:hypothetical protein
MSTKEWIYHHYDGASLYQEMSFNKFNNSPATVEVKNPQDFKIEREEHLDSKAHFALTLEIPADRFDKLAVAWIKHRGILAQVEKYTLKDLLTGPNFELPISEDELLDTIEDAGLAEILKDRECQQEISVDLESDSLFDEIADDDANKLKAKPNLNLQSVDVKKLKGLLKGHSNYLPEDFKGLAIDIIEQIKAHQEAENEESLISLVQVAL